MRLQPLLSISVVAALLALSSAMAADSVVRKPSPPLASLPTPAAAGPLRILLVDDDWSGNNSAPKSKNPQLSVSDRVFRKLVSDVTGGDVQASSIEVVETYKDGPGIDRLRGFSLIVWYTGASYGGNADNSAALSLEDEKTVRRYLEEVGGVVLLVSPGYAERALSYGSTWETSDSKFLSDVMGVRGGAPLAQRFEPGVVTATDGSSFTVGKGPDPESQFSAVNPDGATVLFTSLLKSSYSTGAPMPVATVFPSGRGRLVYVGFTFENLVEKDRAPAFQTLLAASGLQAQAGTSVARIPGLVKQPPAASVPGPAAVQVTGTPNSAVVTWQLKSAQIVTLSPVAPALSAKKSTVPLPQAPGQSAPVFVERLMPNKPPLRFTPASNATEVMDYGPLTPGEAVTYRVTVTDASGTGFKEATYVPPIPRDPDTLTAKLQTDGSVILTWPEVPGVKTYQVRVDRGGYVPVTVTNATEWHSPRLDAYARRWTVNSTYGSGSVLTPLAAWPFALTQGLSNVGLPTPGLPFLFLPNGAGSYAASQAHFRTRCIDALQPGSLCTAAGFILTSGANWEAAWQTGALGWDSANPNWPIVKFTDTLDLGVGRRVNCTPRQGRTTVCWATNHRDPNSIENDLPSSLSLIIMEDDKAFFGSWEWTGGQLPHEGFDAGKVVPWVNATDIEFNYAKHATLSAGVAVDSQGRKGVPHSCLSCHGGRLDPVTNQVVGASLLPLVPVRLEVGDRSSLQFWVDNGAVISQEEQIRRVNQIVLQSNPAPAIVDQINAMYNGAPSTPGAAANDAAVPSGWSQQPGLYRQVIQPYCASCHFAQRGPMNFRSWGNLLQNKVAVQRTVCTAFTMPHSEILFHKFWLPQGNGVSLPGLLSTALGYQTCH